MKTDYIGDLLVNNMLIDIFRDDELCKNRIKIETLNIKKLNSYQNIILHNIRYE